MEQLTDKEIKLLLDRAVGKLHCVESNDIMKNMLLPRDDFIYLMRHIVSMCEEIKLHRGIE